VLSHDCFEVRGCVSSAACACPLQNLNIKWHDVVLTIAVFSVMVVHLGMASSFMAATELLGSLGLLLLSKFCPNKSKFITFLLVTSALCF
jgi:hypothetical protein